MRNKNSETNPIKSSALNLKKRIEEQMQVSDLEVSPKGSYPETLSALSVFMLGAISKSIATYLTYPTIRCKIMVQAADSNDDEAKKAPQKSHKIEHGVLYVIWERERGPGFFKELQA